MSIGISIFNFRSAENTPQPTDIYINTKISKKNKMKLILKFLQQFCDSVQKYCMQIGCTLLILYCLWPSRFASHYEYITSDQIFDSLLQKATKNVTISQQMECDYGDIIMDNTYMYKKSYQSEIFDSGEITLGGVYHPGM